MSESPYKGTARVNEWELRKIFNEDRFAERGESGELRVEVVRSREVLTDKVNNWIAGTLSQELRYYDKSTNLLVAKAHRYLRPDGKLAASGMVDPKRVVRDDIMYILGETSAE
jgi:hypothetical protein